MLLDTVIIVLGFIGLIWGADKFVFGASILARHIGVSPLMIGLTIVAFGTSAPEFFSSAVAALEDNPELAIGNALGSNLFNIGIALGIAALISPLKPPASLIHKELPVLLLVTLVTGALLLDLYLGLFDAIVLILLTGYLSYQLLRNRVKTGNVPELDEARLERSNRWHAAGYLALGLVLLVLSAEALVAAAMSIAETLGVSTAVIGLTLIALGTSLPELAASITCAMRGHYDLAIGNIVGSNILNLLVVLPFPGLFSPDPVESALVYRDYFSVLVFTCILSFVCYRCIKRNKSIGRFWGITFIAMYCGWFGLMFLDI